MNEALALFIGAALALAGWYLFIRKRPFVPGKGWRHYGNFGGLKETSLPAPNFTFGEPHYMTKDCDGLAGMIRVRYRITGKDFVAIEGGKPHANPPTLSVHFQRKGDNWSARGEYTGYRWYSSRQWPIEEGETEIIIPLDREYWIPVITGGIGFAEAVRNASRVGLTFGHGGGRGHGARGNGTFQLISFEVVE